MREPTSLLSERLVLRPWQAPDRDVLAAMNADPRVMEFFPGLLTRGESDIMADHIEQHFRDHGYGPWVLSVHGGGPMLGFAGLYHTSFEATFTPCVELLWRLIPEAWDQGYATEAARAAVRFAFHELELPELVSFAVPANLKSRRVMERIGMQRAPAEDFLHPRLPEAHPLRPHVLYRLPKRVWLEPPR